MYVQTISTYTVFTSVAFSPHLSMSTAAAGQPSVRPSDGGQCEWATVRFSRGREINPGGVVAVFTFDVCQIVFSTHSISSSSLTPNKLAPGPDSPNNFHLALSLSAPKPAQLPFPIASAPRRKRTRSIKLVLDAHAAIASTPSSPCGPNKSSCRP